MQRYKIRTLGKKYGLDDDSLYSYDPNTKAVRYNGRLLTIADDEVDGVSYKNSEKDFLEDVRDWHKSGGDELVAVRDYVSTTGSQNGRNAPKVDFESSEGRVLIGGTSLKPSFISDDGRAYAPKSQVDAVLTALTPAKPTYESAYADRIDRAESRLSNRSFDYDPEEDPAYVALRKQYQREGDRALTDTAGRLAALTGGRVSSAAMTAGAQARMQYAEKLTDSIPGLVADAYERYADDLASDERALDRLYDREAAAYARYQDQLEQFNHETDNANASDEYREEQTARETAHLLDQLEADEKTADTYQKKALIRGYYTPEEAAYFGVSTDTLPWSAELQRVAAMSEQEFADYLKKSELDTAAEKELVLFREESAKREAAYKAAVNKASTSSGGSKSSSSSSEEGLLSTREAKNRLNTVMMGDAQSGLPALQAVKKSIETDYPMLLELGVRYGMTYTETKEFLDETYSTVRTRILKESEKGDDSWLYYGGTLWKN